MRNASEPVRVRMLSKAYWRVTLDNPPVNLFDPDVIVGLRDLVDRLERDEDVKVVVFDSADPDFFISHVDLARIGEELPAGPTGLPAWPDVATRLEHAPCITVGMIRGRARGVGSEFLVSLDIRFASRERAILCQPEIGFGFVPGGGGLERLPLLTGRSRAMEVIVGGDDFDADTAERYGWINRSIPDDALDAFVERFATRVSGFDRQAIITAKEILNQRGQLARGEDQEDTHVRFTALLASPEPQRKVAQLFSRGMQQRSDLEMNLAEAIANL